MPKRYPDTSPNMSGDRCQKKTERSHEENQERAYIAASRRADRSIEARVQSARMASEIHKRRTGKGFKISEEIVMKEEMYEEEDDDLPRQYRAMTAHLQTGSAEMNERLGHYINNSFALSRLARMREIDRMFAEQFPNAVQVAQTIQYPQAHQAAVQDQQQQQQHQHQQHQQHHHQQHQQQQRQLPPPTQYESPTGADGYSQMLDYAAYARDRSQSISHASPAPELALRRHTIAAASTTRHRSGSSGQLGDENANRLSPPALTPGSGSSSSGRSVDTPQSTMTPDFSGAPSYPGSTVTAMDDVQVMGHSSASMSPSLPHSSSFTTELPQEVKQMLNWNPANAEVDSMWQEPQSYESFDEPELRDNYGGYTHQELPPTKMRPHQEQDFMLIPSAEDYFHQQAPNVTPFTGGGGGGFLPGHHSTVGTPGGGPGGDNFDAFFDMDQYSAAWNAANNGQEPM